MCVRWYVLYPRNRGGGCGTGCRLAGIFRGAVSSALSLAPFVGLVLRRNRSNMLRRSFVMLITCCGTDGGLWHRAIRYPVLVMLTGAIISFACGCNDGSTR